ncbi:MAG: saccharopine dehydrogenase NADP-binding domain-containing protein [Saprospiraceae bacterium]|nr:saccharopine dehydrogenase NADP-binding domain-containing protein [Saprospiraceae bacterium]
MKAKIFIAGSGGIGQAVGLIISEFNIFQADIIFGDISQHAIDDAIHFVKEGTAHNVHISGLLMDKGGNYANMEPVLDECDVLLDCLPGSLAPKMAALAKKCTCHYANLTEYVSETNQIKKIADEADTAFVLQTGLAPGFINILACKLYEQFQEKYGNDMLEEMSMKVGALPQNAGFPHFYAFTWSPIGVATEYLKNAVIVDNYKQVEVAALSDTEALIINGDTFEDNYTSGGAANLPEAFSGKIKKLHYKTLRQPGHYQWVKRQLETIPEGLDKIATLEKIMLDNIPSLENDMVVIYASVEGFDKGGRRRKIEKAYKILPVIVGNRPLRAIQTTTAAPMCEMAYMMLNKKWKGMLQQSEIPTSEFLNGPFVSRIYGSFEDYR